jgi:hypothetical protein
LTAEAGLRLLFFVLLLPSISALAAHLTHHPLMANICNGVLPLLVLLASAMAVAKNGTGTVRVGGVALFAVPVLLLAASVAGSRSAVPALFWLAWIGNAATLMFFGYLAFGFRIF